MDRTEQSEHLNSAGLLRVGPVGVWRKVRGSRITSAELKWQGHQLEDQVPVSFVLSRYLRKNYVCKQSEIALKHDEWMRTVGTIQDVDEETDWGEPYMVDYPATKVEYVPRRDWSRE